MEIRAIRVDKVCLTFTLLSQAICSSAAYYAEITHQKLADSGYYEEQTPYKTTDEVIAEVETASH